MQTKLAVVAFALGLVGNTLMIASCSKEKEKDEPLTTEQKADATTASTQAVLTSFANGSRGANFIDSNTRARLRAFYAAGRAQSKNLMRTQAFLDGQDFDICAAVATVCRNDLDKGPEKVDGETCETTSCTNGTTLTCTSPSSTATCGGKEFTFGESTSTTVATCTNGTSGKVTYDIAADFSGSISGGTLTSPSALACKFSLSFEIDINAAEQSNEDSVELSCEEGEFTCTIDGEALSCQDLQKAMGEAACTEG